MNIKIINKDIQGYVELLFEMPLRGIASRMRSRFIKLLEDRHNLIMQEAESLQVEYAAKDENGEVIYKEVKMPDGETAQGFEFDDVTAYRMEIDKMMSEEYIITINPEEDKMLKSVKESLDESDLELKGREAIAYDSLCDALENI